MKNPARLAAAGTALLGGLALLFGPDSGEDRSATTDGWTVVETRTLIAEESPYLRKNLTCQENIDRARNNLRRWIHRRGWNPESWGGGDIGEVVMPEVREGLHTVTYVNMYVEGISGNTPGTYFVETFRVKDLAYRSPISHHWEHYRLRIRCLGSDRYQVQFQVVRKSPQKIAEAEELARQYREERESRPEGQRQTPPLVAPYKRDERKSPWQSPNPLKTETAP